MSESPLPERRRLRWGYWLVGMLCLAVVLGLLRLAYPIYRQRQIVAQLEARGFQVGVAPYFGHDWPLWMTRRTNELIIQRFVVSEGESSCTDEDLKLVTELFTLIYNDSSDPSCELTLGGADVTDVGWSYLRDARNLRDVQLISKKVTPACFACLGTLRLNSLVLTEVPVTDSDLAQLRSVTTLKRLDLSETQITDAGMPHLASFTKLQELYLNDTRISAEGLPPLLMLKELRILELVRSNVWNEGVPVLKRMTTLERLDVDQTRITNKGYEELYEALPKAYVYW